MAEGINRITVEIGGGLIDIDNVAGVGGNKQHDRPVIGEHRPQQILAVSGLHGYGEQQQGQQ